MNLDKDFERFGRWERRFDELQVLVRADLWAGGGKRSWAQICQSNNINDLGQVILMCGGRDGHVEVVYS
jgi:hypothetical protein